MNKLGDFFAAVWDWLGLFETVLGLFGGIHKSWGLGLGFLGFWFSSTCLRPQVTCQVVPEPTDAQVEELMGRYTSALVNLFDQYKVEAGLSPDAKLEIR